MQRELLNTLIRSKKFDQIVEYVKIKYPTKSIIFSEYTSKDMRYIPMKNGLHILCPKEMTAIQEGNLAHALMGGDIFDKEEEIENTSKYVMARSLPTTAMALNNIPDQKVGMFAKSICGKVSDDGSVANEEDIHNCQTGLKDIFDVNRDKTLTNDEANMKTKETISHHMGTEDYWDIPRDVRDELIGLSIDIDDIRSSPDDAIIDEDDWTDPFKEECTNGCTCGSCGVRQEGFFDIFKKNKSDTKREAFQYQDIDDVPEVIKAAILPVVELCHEELEKLVSAGSKYDCCTVEQLTNHDFKIKNGSYLEWWDGVVISKVTNGDDIKYTLFFECYELSDALPLDQDDKIQIAPDIVDAVKASDKFPEYVDNIWVGGDGDEGILVCNLKAEKAEELWNAISTEHVQEGYGRKCPKCGDNLGIGSPQDCSCFDKSEEDKPEEKKEQKKYPEDENGQLKFESKILHFTIPDRAYIESVDPEYYIIQEGLFSRKPKQLKPIGRDLIAYIMTAMNEVEDTNDQAMLSGYICAKLELVDFYITVLDTKDARYIVPHPRVYLVNMQQQLENLLRQVLKIKPINRNDRVWKVNVNYPDGWGG